MLRAVVLFICVVSLSGAAIAETFAWQKLNQLAELSADIGPRIAGTEQEKQVATWLSSEFERLGYQVKTQDFKLGVRKKQQYSQNLIVDIAGESEQIIVVGAHYDSMGAKSGSLGLIDNGSGVATLLGVAHQLKGKRPPYTIRLIAFGAEEFGLQGSTAYVRENGVDKVVAMVNLDTVIGGDTLYLHSAHNQAYKCRDKDLYTAGTQVRDKLMSISKKHFKQGAHQLHKATQDYPEGQTGGWSDHAPFACEGINIAYFEATNFELVGKSGQDGYSQIADADFWTCFDKQTMGSCDPKSEKLWGEIWHTQFDRADRLLGKFEQRLKQQLQQNVTVLGEYLLSK